jgi:actin
VLEVGHGLTQICAFTSGALNHAEQLRIGGGDLTEWMQRLLCLSNHNVSTSTKWGQLQAFHDMKEESAYVALDFDAEMKKNVAPERRNIRVATGQVTQVVLADERFRCPELLFKPYLNGVDVECIDHALFDTIMKCDNAFQPDLYAKIVLSGATTMFEGFPERIRKEIARLAPPKTNVDVLAAPTRNYAAWIGGSVFSQTSKFPHQLLTQEEYNDAGPRMTHDKCSFW